MGVIRSRSKDGRGRPGKLKSKLDERETRHWPTDPGTKDPFERFKRLFATRKKSHDSSAKAPSPLLLSAIEEALGKFAGQKKTPELLEEIRAEVTAILKSHLPAALIPKFNLTPHPDGAIEISLVESIPSPDPRYHAFEVHRENVEDSSDRSNGFMDDLRSL